MFSIEAVAEIWKQICNNAKGHEQWRHQHPMIRATLFSELTPMEITTMSAVANATTHHHVKVTLFDKLTLADRMMSILEKFAIAMGRGKDFDAKSITYAALQRWQKAMRTQTLPAAAGDKGEGEVQLAAAPIVTHRGRNSHSMADYIRLLQVLKEYGMITKEDGSSIMDAFAVLEEDVRLSGTKPASLTMNMLKPLFSRTICTAAAGWIQPPFRSMPSMMAYALQRMLYAHAPSSQWKWTAAAAPKLMEQIKGTYHQWAKYEGQHN